MRSNLQSASELGLIQRISKQFGGRRNPIIAQGIGDDCAILRPVGGWDVVVTTDLLLEGRHFRRDLHAPESVGHRCIARGMSDIAAMGADPIAAFLSLGLPSRTMHLASERRWLTRFLNGMQWLADGSGVVLAGGDTGEVAGDLLVADIVLVGQAPTGTSLRRSGAKAGDAIYVTGALGGAAAELEWMLKGRGRRARRGAAANQPQSFPEPRLRVGAALRRRGIATACLDISDGLSTDLNHLCVASGVRAEILEKELPVHELAKALGSGRVLPAVLHGGEDYELLFTSGPGVRMPRKIAGVAVTRIGEVKRRGRGRPRVTLIAADGSRRRLEAGGWEHFSDRGR